MNSMHWLKKLRDERATLEIHVKQSEVRTRHKHHFFMSESVEESNTIRKRKQIVFEISWPKLTYLSEEYELTFEAAIAKQHSICRLKKLRNCSA